LLNSSVPVLFLQRQIQMADSVRFSRAIMCAYSSIGKIMQLPDGTKPGAIGAAVGALVVAILGFAILGWQTGSGAQRRQDEAVNTALVTAMTPQCVARSAEPASAGQLAAIKAERTFSGARELVVKTGWATSAGAERSEPAIAEACTRKLRA
jgi:hypothetical protein